MSEPAARPIVSGRMPRYFFHSRDGAAYLDSEGAELSNARAARQEATRYLAELLLEAPDGFWRVGKLEVTVTDAEGAVLCSLILTGAETPASHIPV